MKILFLTYSDEQGASARYRVYQFLPALKAAGIEAEVRPFYSPAHYRLIMTGGSSARQALRMIPAFLRRIGSVARAKSYDVVFFHREATPFGPVVLETIARKLGAATILDLDDAIFMNNPHGRSWLRTRFRNSRRADKVIAAVDCVCAANRFIADHARSLNDCVETIEGAEQMERYDVEPLRPCPGRFVVGWIGSRSTEPYLDLLKDELKALAGRIPNLTLLVIGGGKFRCEGVDVVHRPWTLEDELRLVRGFDVGIMPLPDDRWSQGKCGGKARIYMAAGVPAVASAVGYNRELIDDGRTGLLIGPGDSWVEAIAGLHDDPERRRRLAEAGHDHVAKQLSVAALAPKMIAMIRSVAARRGRG